eukprot:TRINITY_DN4188_c0_g1_i6.p1 TRINITY_DN4188_c0_g1~~TRINITY_DN4188_c0_g1_i6.p1  ORF type:complete len:742 (-),score=70.59 TRINITY_DN4188_c0_g1_i6:66-2291(-)
MPMQTQTTLFGSRPEKKIVRKNYETRTKAQVSEQASLRGIKNGTGAAYLSIDKLRAKCKEIDEKTTAPPAPQQPQPTLREPRNITPQSASGRVAEPERGFFGGLDLYTAKRSRDDDILSAEEVYEQLQREKKRVYLDREADAPSVPIVIDSEDDSAEEENELPEQPLGMKEGAVARYLAAYSWLKVEEGAFLCRYCSQKRFVSYANLKRDVERHEIEAEAVHAVHRSGGVIQQLVNASERAAAEEQSNVAKQMTKIVNHLYFFATRNCAHTTVTADALKYFSRVHEDAELLQWLDQDVHYTSQGSLQDLLRCIHDVFVEDTVGEILASPYWSVSSDSTRDVTRKEQLVVCIRFLSSEGTVTERPISMRATTDCSAAGYTAAILAAVAKLPATKLVGISCDGASVMRGDRCGVQIQLRGRLQGNAVFTWCHAHLLNLSLIDASGKEMSKLFSVLWVLWTFISRSIHRAARLKEKLSELAAMCEYCDLQLIEPCSTRWLSHGRCLPVVRKQLPAIVEVVKEMANEHSDAEILSRALADPVFTALTYLAEAVLFYINQLSLKLQARDASFVTLHQAFLELYAELDFLEECPEATDYYNWTTAAELVTGASLAPTAQVQFHQGIAVPYIQAVRTSVTSRFSNADLAAYFSIFDVSNKHPPTNTPGFKRTALTKLLQQFSLPKTVEYSTTPTEPTQTAVGTPLVVEATHSSFEEMHAATQHEWAILSRTFQAQPEAVQQEYGPRQC